MLLTSCVGQRREQRCGHGEEADVSEGRRREDDLFIQLGGIGNLDNRDLWWEMGY